MEIRELNEGDLESLIKLYEQLDGANGDFTVERRVRFGKAKLKATKT